MDEVKFGAPLRISKIVLELSLSVQRDEDGKMVVTTESTPDVDEGMDWRVMFEKIDTPEIPLPSGFYNFTYTESGSLAIQDMPIEVGEDRRDAIRIQMQNVMRLHFNELVSLMMHFPDHEDLMGLVPCLVNVAIHHHVVHAMEGDGHIDEGVRLGVKAEFDARRFGRAASQDDVGHILTPCLSFGQYLFSTRGEADGSCVIQVAIQTKSIYREWVAAHLVHQIQTLVDDQLPALIELEVFEIEKRQGLFSQILDALRCQSKRR